MKVVRLLFSVCAVLFLLETGGANSVYAQKPKTKSNGSVAAKTANLPKVTQVDFEGLKAVLKQNADAKKPLLVNFWATWCEPCREEFPELVKIDNEYRSRGLEFITISLDDLAEINRDVPKFLGEMKAAMPAYLLKTANEEAAIAYVAPDWRGGLPFTVLFDAEGKRVYTRMGIIKPEILRAQLEKVVQPKQP